jgi:hypothetical protein
VRVRQPPQDLHLRLEGLDVVLVGKRAVLDHLGGELAAGRAAARNVDDGKAALA